MVLAPRPTRTLVKPVTGKSQDPHKPLLQWKIDQMLVGINSPFRIEMLKFLARARAFGEPVQHFTAMQKAIGQFHVLISTSNLSYHLSALKQVSLVEQVEGENEGTGYRITALGRKLVALYFTLESMTAEGEFLRPNELDGYVYEHHVGKLLATRAPGSHLTSILFTPRDPAKDRPEPLLERVASPRSTSKQPRTRQAKTKDARKQSSLDSFA